MDIRCIHNYVLSYTQPNGGVGVHVQYHVYIHDIVAVIEQSKSGKRGIQCVDIGSSRVFTTMH